MKVFNMGILCVGLVLIATSCNVKDGDYVYNMDGTTASLVKYTGTDEVVTLPATFRDKKLKYINTGAFKNLPNLREVRIQFEEVYVNPSAFIDCPNLSNVTYSGKIDFWSENVYKNCPLMQNVSASLFDGGKTYSELVVESSRGSKDSKAIPAARDALAMFLRDPKSAQYSNEKIVARRTVHSQSTNQDFEYYIVQAYVRATNAFGAYTTQWFLIEVAIDDNMKQYFKQDNSGVQSFDFPPGEREIGIMKALMGWN